jgi:hypothetical protein
MKTHWFVGILPGYPPGFSFIVFFFSIAFLVLLLYNKFRQIIYFVCVSHRKTSALTHTRRGFSMPFL